MKITLLGYGKMGKLIERSALDAHHEIVGIITSKTPVSNPDSQKAIARSDLCIDFSHPNCAFDHIKAVAALGKPLVVGTTGWSHHLKTVESIIHHSNTGLIHSPNFSIGIALFAKIVEDAAALIGTKYGYDIAGIEMHHKHKVDSPSGTAQALADKINARLPEAAQPLKFASNRAGTIPGTHTIVFDSPADTLTFTHEARNREGFANGAIKAAEWIKERKGFYTLDDLIRTYLCK